MAIVGAACAEEQQGAPPPTMQLYFPTGTALTPEQPGQQQLLLVVSSNFDLRFDSGVLHAFDVEAIDRLVDDAPPPPNCPPDAPRCSPVRIGDFGPAFVGAVSIGDFGGQIGVAQLDGFQRAFIPLRAEKRVVAVDIFAGEENPLRCAQEGDGRCAGASFPRHDPFSVAVEEGNVYVGHIGRRNADNPVGVIGAATADAPFWSGGPGAFETIGLGEQAVGGVATGACRETDLGRTCTLFATSRSFEEGLNQVFLFDFRAGELRTSPVFSRNVFSQQRGLDTRGLAVSTVGNEIYVASRFPAAIATIDVSRIDPQPLEGCVVPPGELLPPGGSCPEGPLPLDGRAEPRFVTADLLTVPPEPNAVQVIPRTLPDGTPSDLVVITTGNGLYFYDARTGVAAGAVQELGSTPASVAVRRRGTGARLYVPSFGKGTLAVVDLPDLFRPASANVIGILGEQQQGAL